MDSLLTFLQAYGLQMEHELQHCTTLRNYLAFLINHADDQSEKSTHYLHAAYEIVGKDKIEKYHQHPEKDPHPEFFYCRDIIKAYEISLNQ